MNAAVQAATSQTARLAVNASVSAANMSGIPGIPAVSIAAKFVQDKLRNCKHRQVECHRLAAKCGDFQDAFERHLKTVIHNKDLPPPVDEFIVLLEEICTEIDSIAGYSPLKLLMKDGEIKQRLEHLDKLLQERIDLFNMTGNKDAVKKMVELKNLVVAKDDLVLDLYRAIGESKNGKQIPVEESQKLLNRGHGFVEMMTEASWKSDSELNVAGVALSRAQFNILFTEVNQAIKEFALQTGLKLPDVIDLGCALHVSRNEEGECTPKWATQWASGYVGNYLDSSVAAKEFRGIPNTSEKAKKRFVNALKTFSVCKVYDHPNVHTMIGVTSKVLRSFTLVSTMEENGNIKEYRRRNPDVDIYHLLAGAAEGLIHLHQKNIVHGNLKASNILISDDGRPLVSQFGLSKIILDSVKEDNPNWETVTRGPDPRWHPPELQGKHVPTVYSDVWSFAMVMYEVFVDEIPFVSMRRDLQVSMSILQGVKPLRPEENKWITDELWAVMNACWQMKAEERTDLHTVLHALREAERVRKERIAEGKEAEEAPIMI